MLAFTLEHNFTYMSLRFAVILYTLYLYSSVSDIDVKFQCESQILQAVFYFIELIGNLSFSLGYFRGHVG
jgi:hypothetical protein